ncbi:CIS tube protein [Streptomyces sp. 8N616]|uniref:CIS tube protein n=1 Tax=Streptomyces sp. 8N616 TaxID=3457414 RepID=UPI003FD09CE6
MTRYADIPKPIRSGIVIVDPERGTPQRIIVLQFNPDTLERSVAPQAAGGEGGGSGGDRNEALRLKGPAQETWKFTAEIDATDQFEFPAPDGIHPQLATLEMLVQPTTAQLRAASRLTQKGTIEISPIETPLTLFTWGSKRVMPVRLTELSVNESAFDVNLNPIRASLSIGMKVLTVSDLPAGHRGAELYLAHLAQKERLAGMATAGRLGALGLTGADIGAGRA